MSDENTVGSEALMGQAKREPIADALHLYLSSLKGIGITASIALPHIAEWALSEVSEIQKNIDKHLPADGLEADESKVIEFDSARSFAEFSDSVRKLDDLRGYNYPAFVTRSLFTQIFAEYDSFMGALIKAIYLKNDKLFNGISREISLCDLLTYESIESVKESMLEKEIDSFRRDSYVEQFSSMEKKFNVRLKGFKEWPEFVELSQRRNIVTHNGGRVSDQYVSVCEREGYKFKERPVSGEILEINAKYFSLANRLLSKVGLMLAFTLWSKVFPGETARLHKYLNDSIYDCLYQKRWMLVASLEDFVLSQPMKRNISEVDFRIRVINIAIGLKFSGQAGEVDRVLDAVDWSASYRDFKLAIAILKERYDEAVEVMRSIGKSGEIVEQADYHSWPLFSEFRKRSEFHDAYLDIYGEPFSEKVSTGRGSVEAHPAAGES